MSANYEDFLPEMFRTRKLARPAQQIQGAGGQGIGLGNMLAPQEPVAPLTIVPSVPDAAIPPTLAAPAPNIAAPSARVDLGQGSSYDPPQPNDPTRLRRVETDNQGRPTPNITMKGDGQAIDLNQRLHSYQPQEAHGWWDRFGKEMVWGALQGLAGGGLGGAIGGAGYGAARGALNPRAANDDWKRKQLRESDINVKNVYDRRDASSRSQKEAAEIEKLAADTNLSLVRAREIADTAKKGRERKIIERRDGVYAVDPLTLKSEKVADIPEEAGPTGNTSYFERPDGVYGVNPQHPDGFKLGGVPGKPETVEDVSFGNQNIGRVIKRKQAEQSKIAQAMMNVPQTIEEEDIIKGTTTTKKNPAYQDLENRYRTLDDDIDELNTQLRSPKKTTMIPAQGAPKNDPLRIFED